MSRFRTRGLVAVIVTSPLLWQVAVFATPPDWQPSLALGSLDGTAFSMVVFDGGDGDELVVGGSFVEAGGVPVNQIARWDGLAWNSLGEGVSSSVRALALLDVDGGGPGPTDLYAAGFFASAGGMPANRVARWDGATWSALGAGTNGPVFSLATFDEDAGGPLGEALYIGGLFTTAGGVVSLANYVARWDGAAWSPLGDGTNTVVLALTTFDPDGPGAALPGLYAGGLFTMAGGEPAAHVARWDGAWSALGDGIDGDVFTLVAFDEDGAGPQPAALFAGGNFLFTGDGAASYIARWNGANWTPVGGGTNGPVQALAVFDDDGPGPNGAALYAAGDFGMAGGASANNLARWNGGAWSALSGGVNDVASALGSFDENPGNLAPPLLFVGGDFNLADGQSANHIARWGRVPADGDADADCDHDLDDLAALVPCITGPLGVPAPCHVFDADNDSDVDLLDVAVFMAMFTGA